MGNGATGGNSKAELGHRQHHIGNQRYQPIGSGIARRKV